MGEAPESARKSESPQKDLKDSNTAMSAAAQQLMQRTGEDSNNNTTTNHHQKVVKREKLESKIHNDRGINQGEEVTSTAKIFQPERPRYRSIRDIYMATKPLNNVKKINITEK